MDSRNGTSVLLSYNSCNSGMRFLSSYIQKYQSKNAKLEEIYGIESREETDEQLNSIYKRSTVKVFKDMSNFNKYNKTGIDDYKLSQLYNILHSKTTDKF